MWLTNTWFQSVCLHAVLQAAAEAKHAAKPPPAPEHSSSFKTPAPPKAATRLGGADAAGAAAAGAAGAKAAAAAGAGGDSPSLTITVLDAVSTGGGCRHANPPNHLPTVKSLHGSLYGMCTC